MGNIIYMDNAATTRVVPEVLEEMLPYFSEQYGNPNSIYGLGQSSYKAVAEAREIIAGAINAKVGEIYFTAGGTEADNWALKGVCDANSGESKHIITSSIEHHAILHTCEYLEEKGVKVTYVGVDENGFVRLDELEKAIRPDTVLISVCFANNEIGTIQSIKEIGALAKEKGILFHTDAVQAFGQIPIDVDEFNIDLLSASAHKVNGPMGVGFLYVREGVKIGSFVHGGAQERKRRAGTGNVPGIVGFGVATRLAMAKMEEKMEKLTTLRDYLIERISAEIPYCRLNGDRVKRLPNNVNFSFQFVEGEALLIMLDIKGIAASSGSACTSGSSEPSHVLLAIGLANEVAYGSLRLTLGEENTRGEVDRVVEVLKEVVGKLRGMNPFYGEFVRESLEQSP